MLWIVGNAMHGLKEKNVRVSPRQCMTA